MDTIAPEIASKLLNRDFANLAQRVQRDGKINRAERVMLQRMAAGAGQKATLAENYVELSKILGVTRRSIQTASRAGGSHRCPNARRSGRGRFPGPLLSAIESTRPVDIGPKNLIQEAAVQRWPPGASIWQIKNRSYRPISA